MGDYGIKGSQKGFDVRTCADHELLFSAGWPLVKIEAQGSVVITDKGADQVIYNHNLNYNPLFLVYDTSSVANNNLLLTDSPLSPFGVTTTDLKWFGTQGAGLSGSVTLYYYVFRYDLLTNFTADSLHTDSTGQVPIDDYGIKISKSGQDISSTDYRDFVIHSNCRSLQIHKSEYAVKSANWTHSVSHTLGYEPMFWFYWYDAVSGYYGMVDAQNQEVKGNADTNSIDMVGVPAGTLSCLIFKDPWSLNE
jgi:hypothetical protein